MLKFNDNLLISCNKEAQKQGERFNKTIPVEKIFWLYYEKGGTIYLKGVDISMLGAKFPDNTVLLMYPMIEETENYYEIDSFRIPLNIVLKYGLNMKAKLDFNLTISKKSKYIFENITF